MIYRAQQGQWTLEVTQEKPHTPRVTISRDWCERDQLFSEKTIELWWTDRWWVQVGELGRRIPVQSWEDCLALAIQCCSLVATTKEIEWLQSYAPLCDCVDLFPAPVILNPHPTLPRFA